MVENTARDLHIHFDAERVVVSATVRHASVREQILQSCQEVARGREIVDLIQVHAQASMDAVTR